MASTIRSLAHIIPRRCCTTTTAAAVAIPRQHQYHTTAALRLPYKNSQDRQTLKPGTNEGTRSGRDEDVAAQKDAAFNPSKTDPESEKEAAGRGNETNPLNASGANQEFNKPMGDTSTEAQNTGPGKETRKGGRSGGGSPQKKGKPPGGGR
ncbi:hypothetical protein BBK36DRAFT_1157163 [Trichoderma citrinoviride]|uniref:Uncharacterized protein n=1 Tax=Trichoderma citrinoviride TaxID=58853 RepID=A0A2T4BHZ4_9HYPO|nr:hypothetical protein BBK36DRAFT_1157163 [Trichoderma citrinoviride]PTB68925.1 hypothetical protein BBK36DRAFT_1157163 [Trichoderma citrinoviride]